MAANELQKSQPATCCKAHEKKIQKHMHIHVYVCMCMCGIRLAWCTGCKILTMLSGQQLKPATMAARGEVIKQKCKKGQKQNMRSAIICAKIRWWWRARGRWHGRNW